MAFPIGQALTKFLALRANGSGTNIAAAVGVALALGLPALGVVDPMLIGAATTLGVSLTNYVVTHYLLKYKLVQAAEGNLGAVADMVPESYPAGSPQFDYSAKTGKQVEKPTNQLVGGADAAKTGGPP